MIVFYTSHSDCPNYLTTSASDAFKRATQGYRVILDAGIYRYLVVPKAPDYPMERIEELLTAARDAPANLVVANADLPPEMGVPLHDVVRKNLERWDLFRPYAGNVIFTVQLTAHETSTAVKEVECYPRWRLPFVGVGGLRSLNKPKYTKHVVGVCEAVRRRYPESHIHVWGCSLIHVRALSGVVDSIDSTKWTRPRTGRGKGSIKGKEAISAALEDYIRTITERTRDRPMKLTDFIS